MGDNKFINNNATVLINTLWTPQWSVWFHSI